MRRDWVAAPRSEERSLTTTGADLSPVVTDGSEEDSSSPPLTKTAGCERERVEAGGTQVWVPLCTGPQPVK